MLSAPCQEVSQFVSAQMLSGDTIALRKSSYGLVTSGIRIRDIWN